jgi:hypothetical protein
MKFVSYLFDFKSNLYKILKFATVSNIFKNRKTIKGHRADSLATAQRHSAMRPVCTGPVRAAHDLVARPRWAHAQPTTPVHALGMAAR